WHYQLTPPRLPNKAWPNPLPHFQGDDNSLLPDDENWIDARFSRAASRARLVRRFALPDRAWCRSTYHRHRSGPVLTTNSNRAAQRPSRNSPERKAYAWDAQRPSPAWRLRLPGTKVFSMPPCDPKQRCVGSSRLPDFSAATADSGSGSIPPGALLQGDSVLKRS